MHKISAVFFGTQNFAAAVLEKILAADFIILQAVVTQPDRPAGRSQTLTRSPVKIIAEKQNIPVFQPESLKNNAGLDLPEADLYIVCQYGLIIPKEIINRPKYGSVNVHASLLPKYRGASPIQTALMNGETETGITIMLMDEKMDHGPVLAQEKIAISKDEDAAALSARLAELGGGLLLKTIPGWTAGEIPSRPQEGEPTFCKLLTPEDGRIDFKKTNEQIYNLYRGLKTWPGIWTAWNGKRLKLLNILLSDKTIPAGRAVADNGRIFIGCGQGAIEALELQVEGKKPAGARIFLNGYQSFNGAVLG